MASPLRILRKIIDDAIKQEKSVTRMGELARMAADKIKKRTRVGRGVSNLGGKTEKLKPLKDSTVKTRKSLKKRRQLSNKTTVKKSNLTQSGQMLDSIKGKGKKFGVGEILLEDSRDDGLTNPEVAGFVSKDRPFFTLSKAEINSIKNEIITNVKRKVEKSIKRLF